MTIQNRRLVNNDTYDPKQRFVGGIVLFLLMLIIYFFLKLVLSVGMSDIEGTYQLREALPDEVVTGSNASLPTSHTTVSPVVTHALPSHFVFLGLDGSPITKEDSQQAATQSAETISAEPPKTGYFYVQAASFREEKQAQALVDKLKERTLESEVVKVGDWYTVRLLPQENRRVAEQQLRQLRDRPLSIKGQIKQIE
ncbi:cell division protein [Beggiatoa alba B18LD]|uniref:Cell division protein n=1 Tax=Beggiatoa alba B18LD TaxID=395493 RepID=I3CHG3_9GAMM|nr:SPOR domain-containing protein [Beggiatoa alba]EIJ43056.1 cell division protein [Beggiatoa alba B18LD]